MVAVVAVLLGVACAWGPLGLYKGRGGRGLGFYWPINGTAVSKNVTEYQYVVVIDAGSTGSRLFVYRFEYHSVDGQSKRDIDCLSSKKATPGLSSFAANPQGAVGYLRPLLLHAAEVVPLEQQQETLVFVQATAGMRLVSEEQQSAIYDALYDGFSRDAAVPFKVLRGNIGTMSGRLEGFYAALSVNYLTGRMNAHLEPHQPHKEAIIGALDMGGSSTQIVFQHVDDNQMELDESDFWVQSYLAYGVDTIRYRLWNYLTSHAPPDESMDVENPCSFAGHVENFKGHRLIGSGRADECGEKIRRMLWDEMHVSCTAESPCGIDGVRHPPLTGQFLAMSVFFFALDCMKQLGPVELPHWPSPSIDEIEHAATKFCAQEWSAVNQTQGGSHAFTRDELLPYRCVEVVYIHTLLKHGYGFPGDSRNITFVLNIEGMEVEWTLGFALAEVEPPERLSGKEATGGEQQGNGRAPLGMAAALEGLANLHHAAERVSPA